MMRVESLKRLVLGRVEVLMAMEVERWLVVTSIRGRSISQRIIRIWLVL